MGFAATPKTMNGATAIIGTSAGGVAIYELANYEPTLSAQQTLFDTEVVATDAGLELHSLYRCRSQRRRRPREPWFSGVALRARQRHDAPSYHG